MPGEDCQEKVVFAVDRDYVETMPAQYRHQTPEGEQIA